MRQPRKQIPGARRRPTTEMLSPISLPRARPRVDIELLSNSLGKNLNRLGVNPVEVPDRKVPPGTG